jgi:excisionase family DNA binding protein
MSVSDRKLLTVKQTTETCSFGRTKAYELIRDGRLDARKVGRRTLITVASLERFIASLPRAGQGG